MTTSDERRPKEPDIPITKPTLPPWQLVSAACEAFYDTGRITCGPVGQQFESAIKDLLGVGEAIAVSSCTSGLMLALKCLGIKSKVALPSFTFIASAHSVAWNGLEPVFVDIDPETWNISPKVLLETLEENEDIDAIISVNIFGNPCDVKELDLLRAKGLAVIYDSAHALGSKVQNSWIGGFGDAEVFSLSPTKIVTAGEGGVITTNDEKLTESLRAGRDYGNTGDYNPSFPGLNARMSEFQAALAIESFRMLEANVRRRNAIANKYAKSLSQLPGITLQTVREGNRSTYKDLTILVDEEAFGLDRDVLSWALRNYGIETRKYYFPPVHRTIAYWEKWGRKYDECLHVTNRISKQALSLPIWSHMEENLVDRVAERIHQVHEDSEETHSGYLERNYER